MAAVERRPARLIIGENGVNTPILKDDRFRDTRLSCCDALNKAVKFTKGATQCTLEKLLHKEWDYVIILCDMVDELHRIGLLRGKEEYRMIACAEATFAKFTHKIIPFIPSVTRYISTKFYMIGAAAQGFMLPTHHCTIEEQASIVMAARMLATEHVVVKMPHSSCKMGVYYAMVRDGELHWRGSLPRGVKGSCFVQAEVFTTSSGGAFHEVKVFVVKNVISRVAITCGFHTVDLSPRCLTPAHVALVYDFINYMLQTYEKLDLFPAVRIDTIHVGDRWYVGEWSGPDAFFLANGNNAPHVQAYIATVNAALFGPRVIDGVVSAPNSDSEKLLQQGRSLPVCPPQGWCPHSQNTENLCI